MKKKSLYPSAIIDGERVVLTPVRVLHETWMKEPAYRKEYDALEWKYQLIGALIDARTKRGFSQEKLAKKIGTKQSAISRFESGTGNPTVEFVQKLADALGLQFKIVVQK